MDMWQRFFPGAVWPPPISDDSLSDGNRWLQPRPPILSPIRSLLGHQFLHIPLCIRDPLATPIPINIGYINIIDWHICIIFIIAIIGGWNNFAGSKL